VANAKQCNLKAIRCCASHTRL